jgi:hypothetical protein
MSDCRIFKLFNGEFLLGRVIEKQANGVVLYKPATVQFSEEQGILFTELFDGLSDSENYYVHLSNTISSGNPEAMLTVLYQIYIEEITEEEGQKLINEMQSINNLDHVTLH